MKRIKWQKRSLKVVKKVKNLKIARKKKKRMKGKIKQ